MPQARALNRPLDGLKTYSAQLKLRTERLVRARPRETVGAGILAFIGTAAIAGFVNSASTPQSSAVAPPAPPPLIMRQIAPDQAVKVNAAIPIVQGPNPSALPFQFKGNSAARTQAVQCLASAVYYEAGSQDDDGERAVAQVVLNRVRHPAFPATVCGVVYEGSTRQTGCQFTFTCDGSMYRQPDAAGWRRATRIAEAALSGSVYAPVGYATHYHADYVVPYWASTLAKSAVVGAHIFYRWAGGWGQPSAFEQAYSGREPNALALRNAALAVVHVNPQASDDVAALEKLPGVEALKLNPSMRGDKRVAVRFNETARAASDQATHQEYVKAFGASDNLKWTLSSEPVASDEKPLGKTSQAAPVPAAAGPSAPSAAAPQR